MLNSVSLPPPTCVINGHFLNDPQRAGYTRGLRTLPRAHTAGTHRACFRSRKCQQKGPSRGGELHFASHSWKSLPSVHPPAFTRPSLQSKLKNIRSCCSLHSFPQAGLCLDACKGDLSRRKCHRITGPNCVHLERLHRLCPEGPRQRWQGH